MRVLVTGAAGFIGQRLVADLAARHDVVALARGPRPDRLADTVDWLEHDLSEPLPYARLPQRIDGIVHLAQSARYKDFPAGAADIFAVNVHSTFRLLEWARAAGAETFVLVSTGGLYGYSSTPLAEDDEVRPGSLYFRSKYAAEMLLGGYNDLLRAVVLRPFFVYGEGQRRMLIPRLAAQIQRCEEIVIDGNPGLRINPLHVDDAVQAFEPALAGTVSGVVNLAGREVVSISQLVASLGEALGIEPNVRHRATDVDGDLVAAVERMQGELGVVPRVRLREGLERVATSLAVA
jgi:nucleoside-diphosphate-sugar epimerase